MPRISPREFKSLPFKSRLAEADDYSEIHELDKWGCRIVWLSLVYGPLAARQFAAKNNLKSKAWRRFKRLQDVGIISLDPEGIAWADGVEPWDSDPMGWFNTLVRVSAGGPLPPSLPRR